MASVPWSWEPDCGEQEIKDRQTDTGAEKLGVAFAHPDGGHQLLQKQPGTSACLLCKAEEGGVN